ncbi:hypothetical protein Skr01_74470 [Sphaerisporangium krabiense]|uniref:Uncharacterized protein n=1 Tax=Sphaerisporangium krabiense TaxID=763782 RepID=A0A7W8Z3L1_9ACTN|nr:hypothetical protein [Sphaerisporangium krabiense]GII67362.1 hypothetical protein Skr01_74470 [Sphaerisporangium krabiense]
MNISSLAQDDSLLLAALIMMLLWLVSLIRSLLRALSAVTGKVKWRRITVLLAAPNGASGALG